MTRYEELHLKRRAEAEKQRRDHVVSMFRFAFKDYLDLFENPIHSESGFNCVDFQYQGATVQFELCGVADELSWFHNGIEIAQHRGSGYWYVMADPELAIRGEKSCQ